MIAGDDDVAYAHSPITHEGLAHTLAARGFATEKFSSSGQLVILGAETVGFSEDFIPEQVCLIHIFILLLYFILALKISYILCR